MTRLMHTGLPAWEVETIERIAAAVGIDARALAALRRIENGGPGREFGVLSVSAPTYEDQARVAAQSLRNAMDRYRAQVVKEPLGMDGRLTADFLRFFSARYAPVGAGNDPTGLNRNHAGNLVRAYEAIGVA
jgi:hypothetical protein